MILEELARLGFQVIETRVLPYETQLDDGTTRRTDYVIDHVRKVIVASPAVVAALRELGQKGVK